MTYANGLNVLAKSMNLTKQELNRNQSTLKNSVDKYLAKGYNNFILLPPVFRFLLWVSIHILVCTALAGEDETKEERKY